MDDELIGWRYDDGLLQEESDRGMQNKKKVWVQGFSHIMLGLADEPEHGKDLKRKIMEVSTKLGLSLPRRTRRKW